MKSFLGTAENGIRFVRSSRATTMCRRVSTRLVMLRKIGGVLMVWINANEVKALNFLYYLLVS